MAGAGYLTFAGTVQNEIAGLFVQKSGGRAVVGGGNMSRGSKPWLCFIVSLNFTYTFKDKITENFQEVDHRVLKPQVWVPF